MAVEDGASVEIDGDAVGGEGSSAAVVAELTDRDQGAGGEVGEEVALAGGERQVGKIQRRAMSGGDGGATGKEHLEAGIDGTGVGVGSGHHQEVAGAASVEDDGGRGQV